MTIKVVEGHTYRHVPIPVNLCPTAIRQANEFLLEARQTALYLIVPVSDLHAALKALLETGIMATVIAVPNVKPETWALVSENLTIWSDRV